jgi:hypothetical protein
VLDFPLELQQLGHLIMKINDLPFLSNNGRLSTHVILMGFIFSACSMILGLALGCSSGTSSTPTPPTTPVSNLSYPQASIAATTGQPISVNTPTITGTPTSYTVNPALPAGLSLSSTTGAISGTPTAVTAQTTYTVTASNSLGSTTATVQIAVNAPLPAPTTLNYPQATITAMVGQAITTDIPSFVGTVSAFAVSPALPAGLNLNSATGAISGTPTAVGPQTTYTVTASNSGGSTATTVVITVTKALASLLDLGHVTQIATIRVGPTRVLSQDGNGHWVLWDYTSGTELASGDELFSMGNFWSPVDMAGTTFVIPLVNGLEVRASSDGHLLSTIVSPPLNSTNQVNLGPSWWKLATDGSYIATGTKLGLSIWSPSGQLVFTRKGDYSAANAFAVPGQVQVAVGPAGQSVIETISASNGTSSVGPAFSGVFNSWFIDGARFLTTAGNTVWTYTAAGVQETFAALPSAQNLTGQGNWFWTFSQSYSAAPGTLQIYPVGGNAPVASYTFIPRPTASGSTIGVFAGTTNSIIDLSGATPSKVDVALPGSSGFPVNLGFAYAALSSSQWIVGSGEGVVVDGASLSATPRYFGFGIAPSIAGSTSSVAVGTSIGQVLFFDPNVTAPKGTLNLSAFSMQLSSDGSVLAAASYAAPLFAPAALSVFSLPGNTLINSWPFPPSSTSGTSLYDFSLSGSGTTIGQLVSNYNYNPATGNTSLTYSRQVTAVTGGPVIWSDSPPQYSSGVRLSLDGTLIAVSNGPPDSTSGTNIFRNGQLTAAAPGYVVGWIDNKRLLVNQYTPGGKELPQYIATTIYDSTGANLATLPLKADVKTIQVTTSNSIYSPQFNTVYSLSTGAATWVGPGTPNGVGAVAGSYVVFVYGTRVVMDSY